MHTSRFRLPFLILASLALTLLGAMPAFADSLAVKQAEASRLAKQVQALGDKVEIAAENYNRAKVRYDSITQKVRAQQSKIAKLQKKQRFLQGHLDTRVSEMYRNDPLDFVAVLVNARSFDDFTATIRILTDLNAKDASRVAQLKQAKAEAREAKAVLVAQQKQAAKHKSDMAAYADSARSQLAARKRLLASVDSEIQSLMAAQLASADISTQARVMRTMLASRSAAQGGVTFGGATAPSAKAAEAIYWAEKQLGKPYVWAADGPDTFDCSGLMLFAYDRAGVHLTHYSGDQINQGQHVSRSNLKPGDLVFFGSPIHHVGMYVGGGNFVEAPYTGTDVRITRLSSRGDYAGACRPAP
jgi:cell wall-associated NlpC family hydrolase